MEKGLINMLLSKQKIFITDFKPNECQTIKFKEPITVFLNRVIISSKIDKLIIKRNRFSDNVHSGLQISVFSKDAEIAYVCVDSCGYEYFDIFETEKGSVHIHVKEFSSYVTYESFFEQEAKEILNVLMCGSSDR